jgi:hypothetical protein
MCAGADDDYSIGWVASRDLFVGDSQQEFEPASAPQALVGDSRQLNIFQRSREFGISSGIKVLPPEDLVLLVKVERYDFHN